jgi:hypothetical protein
MKIKTLVASAALIGIALPAFAETGYFVVQGPDKHCQIVDQRPVSKTETIVGPDGVTYKTRTEAVDAMKTISVCR